MNEQGTPESAESLSLFTYEQAAAILAVSKSTLKRLIATGQISTCLVTTKAKRIPLKTLESFIEKHTATR